MSFKLSSNELLASFEKVSARFSGKRIGAVLSVGDEAAFWYYNEFGTATHGGEGDFPLPPSVEQTVEVEKRSKYPILPNEAQGIRLPIGGGFASALLVPMIGGEFTLEHPGVPATGMVRRVLPAIETMAAEALAMALHDGDYEPQAVQESLVGSILPEALDYIVQSISEEMSNVSDRDTPGKLGGQLPAQVFKRAATITEAED